MNIEKLHNTAEQVSGMMKLLSSPNRLLILCHLVEGERSVGQLCDLVDMKQTAMSQQLSLLRREKVVAPRRDAQTIYYSIADENILKTMEFLYETFCSDTGNEEGT